MLKHSIFFFILILFINASYISKISSNFKLSKDIKKKNTLKINNNVNNDKKINKNIFHFFTIWISIVLFSWPMIYSYDSNFSISNYLKK